ncbi:MAG: hypothetical protein EHM28_15200 [Spirochaetaceae bacterium]|nr:MAG: hypothetical protein EHM28_15200 [Spirochaetaceae bacterium]
MKKSVIVLLAVLLFLSACATEPEFTRQTFPRIDGSTATKPISDAIAARFLSMKPDEASRFVRHNTTHQAYVNLVEGRADIIFVSEPSKDEIAMAGAKGITFETTPVAVDAFVFITAKDNPVQSLTVAQIRDIYTGRIANWKDVGGEDMLIVAFQREPNSGSQTIMQNVVMKGLIMMKPPTERVAEDMGGIIDMVAEYKDTRDSLGYTIYYFVREMHQNMNIKLLGVNGVVPSTQTIRNKSYVFAGPVLAVTRKGDVPGNARALLSWMLSDAGQKLIVETGFVAVR